ncbi:transcriptional regulator SutA [Pseudomonas aeruginosa]|uniref:transcriptional regulator SutA n=1 Tax=Pseudomonas aeruginosa TaxID=287 RepID=UPI003FD217B0
MSEEELEQDELDGADEDDGEELAAADDGEADSGDGDGDGDEAPAPGKKAKAAAVEEELPSVEAKQKERDALAKAMEEFLSRGGKVQEIEPNVVADPPKKPDSKYGSRPI